VIVDICNYNNIIII